MTIQAVATYFQLGRIGNQRRNIGTLKHVLCQQKFRVKILLLRIFIHDSNGLQRHITTLQPPLVAEHLKKDLFQIIRCRDNTRHGNITLTLQQQIIEESAASISINLDQMRTFVIDVKVVTEKNALGTRRNLPPFSPTLARKRESG